MSTIKYRAEKLREIRDKGGKTQSQFAEKFGIPLSTYKNYEQGIREIPIELYTMLLKEMNVDLNILIAGKRSAYVHEYVPNEDLDGIANKGLLRAIQEGAKLGDGENMEKIKLGIYHAIRYALERDRAMLPLG